jgi:hypothetical protein
VDSSGGANHPPAVFPIGEMFAQGCSDRFIMGTFTGDGYHGPPKRFGKLGDVDNVETTERYT